MDENGDFVVTFGEHGNGRCLNLLLVASLGIGIAAALLT